MPEVPESRPIAESGELIAALRRLGLVSSGAAVHVVALTGGVSSDIFKVASGGRSFVVKRALPKLRVAADWHAPTERNTYEVAWFETVARFLPDAVPPILAKDAAAGLFAMAYLGPDRHRLWKADLLDGRVDPAVAAEVGRRLGRIHDGTANDPDVAERFATDHIFHAIRLEPYLEATARRHPEVAEALFALSRRTLATKRALVHGDVSPKNILIGPRGPIFLDAECAWFGDPAFDIAFCLNHLLLKCLWNRPAAPRYLAAFERMAESYLGEVRWEPRAAIAERIGQLLPALFLARIDGKSPVEYVTGEADKILVRRTAVPLIAAPPHSPGAVMAAWATALGL